jgi:hypothetical protein
MALRFDEGKHLQHCLVTELTAFSDDDGLIQDVCTEVLAEPLIYSRLPALNGTGAGGTVFLVARAKALLLTKRRRDQPGPRRIDDLLRSVMPGLVTGQSDEEGLVLLCLAIMKLGQPCEWLVTDYYINERDRALVPDHWAKRAQCKKRLREMLSNW